MSRFNFAVPTIEESQIVLAMAVHQAEFYADRVACERRLLPVTTAAERRAAQAFVNGATYPCTRCGRFAFPQPTTCNSCRRPHGQA